MYGSIYALVLDGTDLYIGGCFRTINGVNRTNLAKLSAATGIPDPLWDAGVQLFDTCNGGPSGEITALALSGTNLIF